ncbi:hypothetical protein ACFSY7_06705 [Kurthia populi]|uniref:Type I restriction enzyme R protein N-terminal domain-containing protein n=1 Tax=Kurthia populi TaxID=1562132 RepID=A0ABW5XYR3_9BACL
MSNSFLEYWRTLDFSDWNEMDVREEFIAPLLKYLGYGKGTIHNVIREKNLSLKNAFSRVGRLKVQIDYIPTIRLKSFWIIEAKPGNKKAMDMGDFLQAHLYAIHPEIQARFIVLINGWEIRIYDALTASDWQDTLYVFNQDSDEKEFSQIIEILGSRNMLRFLRSQITRQIEDSFSVELDENEVGRFFREIHSKQYEMKELVRKNAKEFRSVAWKKRNDNFGRYLKEASLKELLMIMDIPTNRTRDFSNEYYRRIVEAEPSERVFLLDELVKRHRSRSNHSIFYVHSLNVVLVLLNKGIHIDSSMYQKGVLSTFIEFATFNINYGKPNEFMYARCLLDNVCTRIGYKLALTFSTDYVEEIIQTQKKKMHIEELLTYEPNIYDKMAPLINNSIELLWREGLNSSKAADIYRYIELLKSYEEKVEEAFNKVKEKNEGDLLWFESYGAGFDMLLVGTWDILQGSKNLLSGIGKNKEILDFLELEREQVLKLLPII